MSDLSRRISVGAGTLVSLYLMLFIGYSRYAELMDLHNPLKGSWVAKATVLASPVCSILFIATTILSFTLRIPRYRRILLAVTNMAGFIIAAWFSVILAFIVLVAAGWN